jgi:signal transduction histidine kinase
MSLIEGDDRRGDVTRSIPVEPTGADVYRRVIEQLSAVHLTLRGVAGALGGGPLAGRLRESIAELDDATEQLRGAVRPDPRAAPRGDAGLAGRLLEVVMQASPTLDSAPGLHFSGMNVRLPEDVEADLRAVLRQAVTDVAQQTATTDVDVLVAATADRLTAEVTEYGAGTSSCRIGLGDLHRRARDHDGAFSVEPRPPGTRMTWTVPLGQLHAVHERSPTPRVPTPRRAANGETPRS